MDNQYLFRFKSDISKFEIPTVLNNPFEVTISKVAQIATQEFHEFIEEESTKWGHDFYKVKGKMFGVLVIQKEDGSYGYLGAISGKIPGNSFCKQLIPSVLDDSVDDFFLNRGMTELTAIGHVINSTKNQALIEELKEKRRNKSFVLQQQLFENYIFLNRLGIEQNVIAIFENSSHGNPPAAAGECAAPKMLNYAFKNGLKPIALAEFWWGKQKNNKEKEHKKYYPACKNKCRPILEFMLDNYDLYNQSKF